MLTTEDSARVGQPEEAGAPRGMYRTAGPDLSPGGLSAEPTGSSVDRLEIITFWEIAHFKPRGKISFTTKKS